MGTDLFMRFANPLKDYRASQVPPLTQERLAEQMGVTRVCLSRWESGTRRMPAEVLWKFYQLTGIQPAQMRPDLEPILKWLP